MKHQKYIDLAVLLCIAVNNRHYDALWFDGFLRECCQPHYGLNIQSPGFQHLRTYMFPQLLKCIRTSLTYTNHKPIELDVFDLAWSGQWLLYTRLNLRIYSIFTRVDNRLNYPALRSTMKKFIDENTETLDIHKRMKKAYIETNDPNDILATLYGPKALHHKY